MQFVLILTLALWSSSAAFQCPEPTGHFADPTNPHKFYECANGQPYEFSCPDPLVFDPITINCNYTLDVPTTVTTPRPTVTTASPITATVTTASTTTTTSTARTTTARHIPNFVCPELNGHFSDPTNPHKFYECANGEPFEFTCPEPLFFDNTIKNCVFSIDTTTSGPNTTITPSAAPTTSGSTRTTTAVNQTTVTTARTIVFVCPEPNGHFVDPKNAHKFYECANGEAYEFTCPEPLVFDMSIKNCNYAADNATPSPNTTTTTTSTTRSPSVTTGSTVLTTSTSTQTPGVTTVGSTQTPTTATQTTTTSPVTTIHPTGPPVTSSQTETLRVRHTDSFV